MEALARILEGLQGVFLDPTVLLAILIGCFLGTIIGMLPGLGPSTAIALMIPLAFAFEPEVTLPMAVCMYLGAEFGGRISAILLNVPGDVSAMMTTLDGHPLAKSGKAAYALSLSAIASFLGSIVGIVGLIFFAPSIASLALALSPTEYFALILMAIVIIAVVLSPSTLKGVLTTLLGLAIATIGIDPQLGTPRFTFGNTYLLGGISDLALIIGVFGVGEVLWILATRSKSGSEIIPITGRKYPRFGELWRLKWSSIRGSLLGFIVGVLPGAGSGVAGALTYAVEKRVSKHPETFGKGAEAGVVGPESGNNAAAAGSIVPMLSLGIPGSGTAAVLLAFFISYGFQPGPGFFDNQPQMAWIVVASMLVGAIALLFINLPLVGIFAKILKVPYHYLLPAIMVLAIIGGYAISNSMFDVYVVLIFGVLGFGMRYIGFSPVLLVISVILGGLAETKLRQAVVLSHGDYLSALLSPLAIVFYAITAFVLVADLIGRWRSSNQNKQSKIQE
jgi:putative tricarboxylic transport membrane protein